MTEQLDRQYKLLVVDDSQPNREAALAGLGEPIDFATTYEEAIAMVGAEIYGAAIIDLNFPRVAGNPIQALGVKLNRELDKYGIPSVILTSTDHAGIPDSVSLISLYGFEFDRLDAFKSTPEPWIRAFQKLQGENPDIEHMLRSRERFLKYTGRMYKTGQ